MIRRNPGDQDLRDLERRATAGDPEAVARLEHARRRRGVLSFPADHPIFDPNRTDRTFRSGLNPGWLLDHANNVIKATAITYLQREFFDVVRVEVVEGPQTVVQPHRGYGRWAATEHQWAWPPEWELQQDDGYGERHVVPIAPNVVIVRRLVIVGHLWSGQKWAWPVIGRMDSDASDFGSAEQRALAYLNHNKLMGVPRDWLGYPTVCASMAPTTMASWKKEHARLWKAITAAGKHDVPHFDQALEYLDLRRRSPRGPAERVGVTRTPFYPSLYMRWVRTIIPDAFRNMLPEDAYGAKVPSKDGGWDVRSRVVAMQEAPTESLGTRTLRLLVEVDRMPPADRLRWATKAVGHGSSTRPSRILFPDRPRGFIEAARAVRDFAEWSAWAEDRSTMFPYQAARVDADAPPQRRYERALDTVEHALGHGATLAEAAEALRAIRLTDVGAGILRGDPISLYRLPEQPVRRGRRR